MLVSSHKMTCCGTREIKFMSTKMTNYDYILLQRDIVWTSVGSGLAERIKLERDIWEASRL